MTGPVTPSLLTCFPPQEMQPVAEASQPQQIGAAPDVGSMQQPGQTLEELQQEVLGVVRDLVGGEVDPGAPLGAQGLDSLAAMELRQKLQVWLLADLHSAIHRCFSPLQRVASQNTTQHVAAAGTDKLPSSEL